MRAWQALKSMVSAAAVGLAALAISTGTAFAIPITATFVDDGRCDPGAAHLRHELVEPPAGDFFPSERIESVAVETNLTTCNPDPSRPGQAPNPLIPDWEVTITNASGRVWAGLWFVVDLGPAGGSVWNADGTIAGADAFRIDNIGINQPLIGGDDGDLLFEPGEAWTFLVIDFVDPVGGNLRPFFGSNGFAAGSPTTQFSTASILTVPEPMTAMLLGLGLAGLGFARRRRRG